MALNARPFALVAGSGGVLGEALLQEFGGAGYTVAGLRRSDCNLADAADLAEALARQVERHGPVDVLLYNAGHLAIAPFLTLEPAAFEACVQAGPLGAANCARAVLPAMLARGAGSIVFTGATASLRGSAHFAAMAAGKAGLRGLAQALAREYQPQGIHVAHVVLDGLLGGSASVLKFGKPGGPVMAPRRVAAAYRALVEQPADCWAHEIDLRPAGEKF